MGQNRNVSNMLDCNAATEHAGDKILLHIGTGPGIQDLKRRNRVVVEYIYV